MDVIFQARVRVLAREIHIARGNFEVAVDKMHQPMGQIAGKYGPK